MIICKLQKERGGGDKTKCDKKIKEDDGSEAVVAIFAKSKNPGPIFSSLAIKTLNKNECCEGLSCLRLRSLERDSSGCGPSRGSCIRRPTGRPLTCSSTLVSRAAWPL